MVNPGVFHGSRLTFLIGEKLKYLNAVDGDYVKDTVADIQRRFLKRFPVDLPLDEEPSPDHLVSVNDSEPDPEIPEPDQDELSPNEYKAEMARLEERRELVKKRKGQIKHWLSYQYWRDNDTRTTRSNPYQLVLCQLTGMKPKLPQLNTAVNGWRQSHRAEIEAKTSVEAERLGRNRSKDLASIREQVAKNLFKELSLEEQEEWATIVKEEHTDAMTKWNKEIRQSPSKSPADRQRAIQNLPTFVQPILDGICTLTGWKATLIAGGPEPVHNGRLNVISVHSGVTKGEVKMNFGRAEHVRYKEQILPVYGDFLKKCYSVQDCCVFALTVTEEFESLEAMELEGVNVDSVPTSDGSSVHVAPPAPEVSDVSTSSLASEEGSGGISTSPLASEHSSDVSTSPLAPEEACGDVHASPRRDNLVDPPQATRDSESHIPPLNLIEDVDVHRSQTPIVSQPSTPAPLPPVTPPNSSPQGTNKIPKELTNDLRHAADDEPMDLNELPTRGQMQLKQGLDNVVATTAGEEGMNVPSKWYSKRRRFANQIEKDSGVSAPKKPAPSARPTQRKYGKKGTASQTPPIPPSTSTSASWFSSFQEMFLGKNLGDEWTNFVSTWVAFESQAQNKKFVTVASQPKEGLRS